MSESDKPQNNDSVLPLTTKLSLYSSSAYYSMKSVFNRYLNTGGLTLPHGDTEDVVLLGETFAHKADSNSRANSAKENPPSTSASVLSSTEPPETPSASTAPHHGPVHAVQRRLQRCLWMTYRTGFPPFSNLSSDVGWGCTLRSTQMLAAETLLRLLPPTSTPTLSNLTISTDTTPDSDPPGLPSVLQCFLDLPQGPCPLSLHNMISYGRTFQVKPGMWYGPYSACLLLRAALQGSRKHLKRILPPRGIKCMVVSEPGGGAPCISQPAVLTETLTSSSSSSSSSAPPPSHDKDGKGEGEARSRSVSPTEDGVSTWTPTLLLIPLHLGLSGLNPLYIPQIKRVLAWPQCVGVIGGRPGSSFFLIGVQGDHVLYLDPHESQEAAKSPEIDPALRDTYRPRALRSMKLTDIDPSMAFGFVVRGQEEFVDFLARVDDLGDGGAPALFTWSRDVPSPKHKRVQSGVPKEGGAAEGEDWEVL